MSTDLVARLREKAERWRKYASESLSSTNQTEWAEIAALSDEAAVMLERAHSIITIREAGMRTAKGQAWLAQLEGRPYV